VPVEPSQLAAQLAAQLPAQRAAQLIPSFFCFLEYRNASIEMDCLGIRF
jgi:hypothetical protein